MTRSKLDSTLLSSYILTSEEAERGSRSTMHAWTTSRETSRKEMDNSNSFSYHPIRTHARTLPWNKRQRALIKERRPVLPPPTKREEGKRTFRPSRHPESMRGSNASIKAARIGCNGEPSRKGGAAAQILCKSGHALFNRHTLALSSSAVSRAGYWSNYKCSHLAIFKGHTHTC